MGKRNDPRPPKQCRDCGADIIGHFRQVHCYSGGCGVGKPDWWPEATRDGRIDFIRRGSVPAKFTVKVCEECQAEYQPPRHSNKRSKYCSKPCKNKAMCRASKKYKSTTKGIENRRERLKQRLASESIFRLKKNQRERMRIALRSAGSEKPKRTLELVGLDGDKFMYYLLTRETNAHGNFTADNYGTVWHVDHIKPLASYDLTDPKQVEDAFHFSNCQPLSISDNAKKSSIYLGVKH